jgi:RNA polymerase-binding protein DksA
MKTTIHVNKIKQVLEEQRKTLIERSKLDEQTELTYNPDRSDLANRYTQKQRDQLLMARAGQHLIAIEASLKRIQNGTYGICTRCGRRIHPARLEAIPTTELCMDCRLNTDKQ